MARALSAGDQSLRGVGTWREPASVMERMGPIRSDARTSVVGLEVCDVFMFVVIVVNEEMEQG